MEGFSGALDDILVSIYRNVLRLEKQMLKRSRQTTLSVSEVHLILCLGDAKGAGCTVTELGKGVDTYNRICRRQLVDEISRGLSDEEKKYVLLVIRRLNEYFAKTIGDEL